MINQPQPYTIYGLFPTAVYIVKRNSKLSPAEEQDIEDVCKEGGLSNTPNDGGNSTSNNSYIFNGKLKELKQFCEQQIKLYVEQVICPKEELDFYITQSWLNITKPGEFHHSHSHQNSIISGVFYISTEEDDTITFSDPATKTKSGIIQIPPIKWNQWNSETWAFPSIKNELLLFPSWLTHRVDANKNATTNRISLSFNTFIRGTLGSKEKKTELIVT